MDRENLRIVSEASQAIKPTIWFSNSILDNADLATEQELKELKNLTKESTSLKNKIRILDNKIRDILTNIDKRRGRIT